MSESEIIFAGNSHLTSLGVKLLDKATGQNSLVPLAGQKGQFMAYSGEWPRSGGYWRSLAEISKNKTVVLIWKGNQHLAKHLISGPEQFDFVSSVLPELPVNETAVILPEEAIRYQLSKGAEELDAVFALLKASETTVIFAGTPPPKGDIDFLHSVLSRERHFRTAMEAAGVDSSTVKLCPPIIQLKLWLLLQDIYKDLAFQHSITFLPSPARAQDHLGFLRRDLWAEDATHANVKYGDMLLADLRNYLSSIK